MPTIEPDPMPLQLKSPFENLFQEPFPIHFISNLITHHFPHKNLEKYTMVREIKNLLPSVVGICEVLKMSKTVKSKDTTQSM
jgi:hypothetical protein